MPLLLAAFSASTGERYAIDLLQAIELEGSPTTISNAYPSIPRGQTGSGDSKVTTARLIVPQHLPEDIARTVHSRFRTSASDSVGKEAAVHFSFANELTDLANIKDAVAKPALQSYYLCVERIVKRVASGLPPISWTPA